MNRVLPLARHVPWSGLRSRADGSARRLAVTSRYERILIIVDRVERIGRSITDSAAKLAMFLIAVVPAVAVHIILFQSRAPRPGLAFLFVFILGLFRICAFSGPFAFALGAIVARDSS